MISNVIRSRHRDNSAMRVIAKAIAILVILRVSCFAQLQWDSKELELKPSPLDSETVAHFKFKNVGVTGINLNSVSISCDCTTIQWPKSKTAPGDSGDIVATFSIGDRVGLQEKTIVLKSTDAETPQTILTFKVQIPEVIRLEPKFLQWERGDSHAAKTIHVKILNEYPVKALSASSSNPAISTKVEQSKGGEGFDIVVTPKKFLKPIATVVKIVTDYPPEKPKVVLAYVRVNL